MFQGIILNCSGYLNFFPIPLGRHSSRGACPMGQRHLKNPPLSGVQCLDSQDCRNSALSLRQAISSRLRTQMDANGELAM